MGQKIKNPRNSEQEPSSHSFVHFLRSWRYFIVLLCLGVLIAVFYEEENWRGKWAWNHYKREMARRGARVDRAELVPKPVPLSENFAMTPFLSPIFDFVPGTQRWRSSNAMAFAQGFATDYDAASRAVKQAKLGVSNSWISARTDLAAWYDGFQRSSNGPGLTDGESQPPHAWSKEAAAGVLDALSEC